MSQQWRIPGTAGPIRLSEVVAAMSAALDITEGQPEGHAVRSCAIGMRLVKELKLSAQDRSDLFYALLLKDLGCSSNAAKVCNLFGSDDRQAKRELKLVDWSSVLKSIGYIARNVASEGSLLRKVGQFFRVAKAGPAEARQMVETRCDRGAAIARQLLMTEEVAVAIRSLDEHWDGYGHPAGLKGDQIPLLSRILNLAQTAEVFWAAAGVDAAFDVVRRRRGTWFDPELSSAFKKLRRDESFWASLPKESSLEAVSIYEPGETILPADDDAMDRLAEGFSMVVDAKSPWTYKHSSGVAEIAEGIAVEMGCMPLHSRYIRRAGLLHDLGKLGVSNMILDKPGKLDADELATMRKHPANTFKILNRVSGFRDLAEVAAGHHERLDGKGYHRGVSADAIPLPARILGVADMYEALAARRPYRQDLTEQEVMTIMEKNVGSGLCPEVFGALQSWLVKSRYTPIKLAA